MLSRCTVVPVKGPVTLIYHHCQKQSCDTFVILFNQHVGDNRYRPPTPTHPPTNVKTVVNPRQSALENQKVFFFNLLVSNAETRDY